MLVCGTPTAQKRQERVHIRVGDAFRLNQAMFASLCAKFLEFLSTQHFTEGVWSCERVRAWACECVCKATFGASCANLQHAWI